MLLQEVKNTALLQKEFITLFKKIKTNKTIEEHWEELLNKIIKYSDKINNIIKVFEKTPYKDLMLNLSICDTNNEEEEIISFKGLEFYICKYDEIYFLTNYVKIKNPNPALKGLIPFKLYNVQKKFINILKEERYVIVRKSRQIGYSTIMQGIIVHQMNFFKGRSFPILSQGEDEAIEFNEKIQIQYGSIPYWLKTKAKEANKHKLVLDNFSSAKALSSSKQKGRSSSGTILTIDEGAFIEYIDTIWKASFPVISQTKGKAVVISTVNGVGNWYYKTYTEAVEGKNNFYPLFIKWWEVPDRDNAWLEQYEKGDFSFLPEGMSFEVFIEKLESFEIENEWLIDQRKQLGERGFKQEVLAEFLSAGNTVLSSDILSEMQQQQKTPILKDINLETLYRLNRQRVLIQNQNILLEEKEKLLQQSLIQALKEKEKFDIKNYFKTIIQSDDDEDEKPKKMKVSISQDIRGLWFWKMPNLKSKYVALVDVGTGRADDNSCLEIFDIETNEQVCEFYGIINTLYFSYIINAVATFYNMALTIIESNGVGLSVLTNLLNENDMFSFYRNVYFIEKNEGVKSYHRSVNNREKHIDLLMNDIKYKRIIINSERFVNECLTFVWYKKGVSTKARHDEGCHDDTILATTMYEFFVEELKGDYVSNDYLFNNKGDEIEFDNTTGEDLSMFMTDTQTEIETLIENPLYRKIYYDVGQDEEKFFSIVKTLKRS